MSSYVRNPSVGVQEHTFGFGQKMERETFSRATFVNRVQFPSTSSLAPLRLFLLVCVFFCLFVWGCFLLSVCFIACPEPTVTKPKFSHSVHHEGKGHGYYSHVRNWYSMSLAITFNTRKKKNLDFETMKWQLVTTVFVCFVSRKSFKLRLNFRKHEGQSGALETGRNIRKSCTYYI